MAPKCDGGVGTRPGASACRDADHRINGTGDVINVTDTDTESLSSDAIEPDEKKSQKDNADPLSSLPPRYRVLLNG